MTNRILAGLLASLCLLPAMARAQANDDWEGFKAGSPPPKQNPPAPTQPAAPAPTPAPASSAAPSSAARTSTAAAPRTDAPLASATAPGEAKLVSTKESVVNEGLDHSPSTLHNDATDSHNARDAAGEGGAVGVLHVGSAHFGPAQVLRFSASGEYFHSTNFPVLQATDTRSAGVFALGYTFTPWLQGYASYTVLANTNNRSSPHLIQDQGDATFGLAVGTEVARGLSLGLDARALLSPGTGNQDLSRSVLGFLPRGLLTYDFHALSPTIPLRAHLNAGLLFDKTTGFANGHTLTAAEEFALQTNRFNRVVLGGALELPLTAVTPFAEYNAYVPMGASNLVAPDNTTVNTGAAMAQTLGLGVRVTAIQDLTLDAAVDLGLSRTVAYGIPATPPYNIVFGATYAIDPFGNTRTKLVDRTYERTLASAAPAPTKGRVVGTAIDAATNKPLPGVIVAFADLPPVASDATEGRFISYEMPPGPVKLSATATGYQAATADAVVETGKVSVVQLRLTANPQPTPVATPAKPGSLSVKVLARKKKLTTAAVTLGGGAGSPPVVTPNGPPVALPPGHYTLSVAAEGYAGQSHEIDVAADKALTERFDLKSVAPAETETPRKQLVVIVKNKLVIKQQVHFATNKAVILRDSFALLDQVADAIKSNSLKKVLVEGHTDNQGAKDLNLKLSTDRANAVRSYLLKKGIAADMLEAKGFGDSRPIAPNMTAKGREANRRVEFTIEER
jgi:OOP family OmpA-OmpF porin